MDPLGFYGAGNARQDRMQAAFPELKMTLRGSRLLLEGSDQVMNRFQVLWERLLRQCSLANGFLSDDAFNEAMAGLYHVAASGETNWHAYASHVIRQAKALRPDLPWAVHEIAPVPSSAIVTAARRPHKSRLDTRKLQAAFGINLPHWQQGVDEMLAQVLSSTPRKETS